jgi:hypothetical protein
MAKKAKKRPTRKTTKSKKTAARRSRSPARKTRPAKKAAPRKAAPKTKAKHKAARRAAAPARKASPSRVTARTVRQRAAPVKPIRHLVEDDEPRERMDAETKILGSRGGVDGDDLAEELGEAFVMTATSGEQADEDIRDQEVPEERGGPFVVTPAGREFASGTDESNPADAEPAALPTSSAEEPE